MYIDVGANDPAICSCTKWFYDHGWSGINIEPGNICYKKLLMQRPRDINLNVAIGNEKGHLDFYEIKDANMLSTTDKNIALMHQRNGLYVHACATDVLTLNDICIRYISDDIHFLKIDVEGFELQVLQGMDFNHYRPWIILVEITTPTKTQLSVNSSHINELLKDNNYEKVYFDGLNEFYICNEKLNALKPYFNLSPKKEFIKAKLNKIIHTQASKIILYPMGQWGKFSRDIMDRIYKVKPYKMLDNYLCKTKHNIFGANEVTKDDFKDTVVIITCESPVLRNQLEKFIPNNSGCRIVHLFEELPKLKISDFYDV